MPRFDITIAGEVNLDIILYGLPEQLPVERELLAERCMVTLGSSSAITAHNLAILGSKVGFITRVGQDSLGPLALDWLQAAGVDLTRIVHSNTATGLTVVLPHGKVRHMLTSPGCMAEMTLEDLDLEYLASARHFHLSSYFLQSGLRDRVPELFARLKRAGLTLSMDTNDDPDGRWDGSLREAVELVDILMPNEQEACKIAGIADFDEAVERLSEIVPTLVVKMGSKGALAAQKGSRYHASPLAVEVVDSVGAGDTFNAGFLHEYVRGADLKACLARGNQAAAYSTTQAGGAEAFRDRPRWQQFCQQQVRS
jgi:sugar/nucleoside kinase (ribokinase family)